MTINQKPIFYKFLREKILLGCVAGSARNRDVGFFIGTPLRHWNDVVNLKSCAIRATTPETKPTLCIKVVTDILRRNSARYSEHLGASIATTCPPNFGPVKLRVLVVLSMLKKNALFIPIVGSSLLWLNTLLTPIVVSVVFPAVNMEHRNGQLLSAGCAPLLCDRQGCFTLLQSPVCLPLGFQALQAVNTKSANFPLVPSEGSSRHSPLTARAPFLSRFHRLSIPFVGWEKVGSRWQPTCRELDQAEVEKALARKRRVA